MSNYPESTMKGGVNALNEDSVFESQISGYIDVEERNAEIYRLRQTGYTLSNLARRFSLSPEWIRRVCEDQEQKHNYTVKGSSEQTGTELYLLVVDENSFRDQGIPSQVFHCRCKEQGGSNKAQSIEYFRKLTEDEIRDVHGAGGLIEALMERVKSSEDCIERDTGLAEG